MKLLDRYLQKARFRQAKKFIRKGDRVLDIGSDDGCMFTWLHGHIVHGTGIEPTLQEAIIHTSYEVLPGYFPAACPPGATYDVITMLAVLEHIPADEQKTLGQHCLERLSPGGRVVITVPSPQVDLILDVLSKLRLIDGMQLHEHYGFKPEDTMKTFGVEGLRLLHHRTFQLGLNNLFVFEKA